MKKWTLILLISIFCAAAHAETEELDTVSLSFDSVATGDSFKQVVFEELIHHILSAGDSEDYKYFQSAVLASGFDRPSVDELLAALEPVFEGVLSRFIHNVTGQRFLPDPDEISISQRFVPLGHRGSKYIYSIQQTLPSGVECDITLEISSPTSTASITAIPGTHSYQIFYDDFHIKPLKFEVSNSESSLTLDGGSKGLYFEKMDMVTFFEEWSIPGLVFNTDNFEIDIEGILTENEKSIEGTVAGIFGGMTLDFDFRDSQSTIYTKISSANVVTHLLAEGVHREQVADYDQSMTAITVIEESAGSLSIIELLLLLVGIPAVYTWSKRNRA